MLGRSVHIRSVLVYQTHNQERISYFIYNAIFDKLTMGQKYPRPEFRVRYLTEDYGNVIHDYCNVNDPVCASGTNLAGHLVYPEIWDTTAAGWVQSVLDKEW